jgi:hypothetical protein
MTPRCVHVCFVCPYGYSVCFLQLKPQLGFVLVHGGIGRHCMAEGRIYEHTYEWDRVYKIFNYNCPSRRAWKMKLVATSAWYIQIALAWAKVQ